MSSPVHGCITAIADAIWKVDHPDEDRDHMTPEGRHYTLLGAAAWVAFVKFMEELNGGEWRQW